MQNSKKMVFVASIADRRLVTKDTYEFTFDLSGHDFHFRAGQYVWVYLPELLFPDARGSARAFSIVSSPATPNRVSLLFRSSESGFKKTLLAFPVGASVRMSGPFGFLDFPEHNERPVVFVAGGVGIAPFLSMMRDATERKSKQRIVLLYANPSEELTPYREELMRLRRENSHLSVFFITGEITKEFISKATGDLPRPVWYVIGTEEMVAEAGRILSAMQVPDEDLRYEEFSPFLYRTAKIVAENRASEMESLRAGVESAISQIILTDPEGKIFYANPAAEKTTGYSLAEMIGQTPRLWGGLMSHEFYKDLWNAVKRDRKSFSAQVTNRRKSGEEYIANAHIAPFLLKNGDIGGFVGTEEDVTGLVRAKEEALLLADIVRSSRDAIVRVNLDGIIMSWNPAAERMYQYTAEEVIGTSIFDKIGGLRESEMRANLEMIKQKKDMRNMRSVRRAKNGSIVPVLISVWPIYDINDKIVGLSALYHDISHEDALRLLESQFITIAAHQLRTPLTGIQWTSERFLKTEKLTAHGKEYLKDINDSTLRIIKLVNTLLNTSRIEGGAIAISPIRTDVIGFVSDMLKEYRAAADAKKQTLDFSAVPKQIDASIDQNAFQNIVQSLVANALEFTPENGTITVHLEKEKENFIFTISDTGIGIPAEAQSFVFEKFFRAENAKAFKADGTGLGLYIASEATKFLGGNISFVSEVGKGTTFTVTIPLVVKPREAEKSLS